MKPINAPLVENEQNKLNIDFELVGKFQAASRAAGIFAIAVGSLVLIGWAFAIAPLKGVLPGLVSMKANTAVSFVLAGSSLLILAAKQVRREIRWIGKACAIVIAFISLLSLAEHLVGWNLGIDEWLFKESLVDSHTLAPGRMALATAVNFLFLAGALLLAKRGHGYLPAQWLSLTVLILSLPWLMGYVYGVSFLFQLESFIPVALYTTITFLVVGIGILFLQADRGFMAIIASRSTAGTLARRLLPIAIVVPFFAGWLLLIGQRARLYGTEFGTTLFALTTILSIGFLILWNAGLISKGEGERGRALEAMQLSDERLLMALDSMLEGCQIIGFDWRYLYVNEAAARQGLQTKKELLGHTMMEKYPGIEKTKLFSVLRRCMETRTPQRMENEFAFPNGATGWFDLSIQPITEGIFIFAQDITERNRAEQELLHRNKELLSLHQVGQELGRLAEPAEILESIFNAIGQVLDNRNFYIALYDEEKKCIDFPIYSMQGDRKSAFGRPLRNGLTEYVIRERAPLFIPSAMDQRMKDLGIELFGTPSKTFLAVPMQVGQKIIGVIAVQDYEHEHAFTESDVGLLSTFAAQAAIALENARLFEEMRNRADEFAALFNTARDLSAQTDVARLLETIVERAEALLNVPAGAVYLYDAARNELELALSVGMSLPIGTRLKMGEGAAGRAAQSREPLIVDDYKKWEHRSRQYKDVPFASVMHVPMLYGGALVGVLAVHELGESKRQFNDADARLLALLASQAASAVDNARLLKETRARAEEFQALLDIATEVSGQTDLSTLLQTISQRAMSLLSAAGGGMYLYDKARGDLEMVATLGIGLKVGTHLQMGEGMAGRVAVSRQPLIVDNYQTWENRSPQYKDVSFSAVIEVPMLYHGELIGVLVAFETGESQRRFTEQDVQLLTLFATQAASAVHNARLLEEARARADEFQTLFDTAKDVSYQTELPKLLQTIVERTMRLLLAHGGAIYSYDASRGDLELVAALGIDVKIGTRLKPGEGMAGQVALSREPLIVDDYRTWALRSPQYVGVPYSAVIQVPMLYGGELIGVLAAFEISDTQRRFTDRDAQLLSLFAAQAASTVHNARLLEETKRRAEQFSTVNEIDKAVSSQLELSQVLEVIYQQVQRILPLDAFYIALYDQEKNELSYPLLYDEHKRYSEPPSTPKEGNRLIQTIRTGKPIRFNHTDASYAADPKTNMLGNTSKVSASKIYAPLLAGARVIGAMSAQSYTFNAYTDEHLELLTGIANQAAIAIENARLYSQSQRLLQDTQRHLLRVQSLHEIDNAIGGSLDLRVTFDVFLGQIIAQLGVDATDILLLNPHTQMLEFAAGRGFRTAALQHTHLRLGDGLAGQAALDQKVIAIPDLTRDIDGLARSPLISSEGYVSYYGVPLIAKGRVNGVLEIFQRSRLDADREWLDFLETLAGQAAIAIDNSGLYSSLQRANIDLALAYDTTLEGWSRALDLRDQETEGHTQRVTELTLQLGRTMGISEADLVHVRRGALLHDIGKMGIPDAILFKPGPLTDDEWKIMQQHPVFAFELIAPIEFLRPAVDIPYAHHEKWDGTGYPRRLKGEQIPLAARLFAVADVWDALLSDRPYRAAWTEERVRQYIRDQSGSHFDPNAVKTLLMTLK